MIHVSGFVVGDQSLIRGPIKALCHPTTGAADPFHTATTRSSALR